MILLTIASFVQWYLKWWHIISFDLAYCFYSKSFFVFVPLDIRAIWSWCLFLIAQPHFSLMCYCFLAVLAMVFEDVFYYLLYLQNISFALQFTAILIFFMTAFDCFYVLHSDLPNSGICSIILTTPASLMIAWGFLMYVASCIKLTVG